MQRISLQLFNKHHQINFAVQIVHVKMALWQGKKTVRVTMSFYVLYRLTVYTTVL